MKNKLQALTYIGIFFILAGLSVFLINVPSIQEAVFELCAKVKGHPLNIEKTLVKLHSFIIMNSFISILIGCGFITLRYVNFSNPLECEKFTVFSFGKIQLTPSFIISSLIFLLLVAIRIYWCTQKVTYHMDELYGIGIVNKSKYNFWTGSKFPTGIAFSGEYLKNEVMFNDGSLKDCIKDLITLWFYNCDTAYTSLFLMLFRLSFIFTKTYSFSTVIAHGFILNLIFFCFAFYFFVKLLDLLTDSKILKLILPIAAFANPASVSISIFLRAYALQEALLILFTYFFVWFYKALLNEKPFNSLANFIKGSVLMGIVLSSDYFTLFYVALLGLFIIITCIIKKKYTFITYFFAMALCSLLVAKCLYLNWGSGLLTDRGKEALSQISLIQGIIQTLHTMAVLISRNYIYFAIIAALIILSVVIYFINKKNDIAYERTPIIITLFAILWICLILYLAPYKTMRYIAAVFPMLSMVFIISLPKKFLMYRNTFVSIATVLIFINILPLKMNKSKIEHLEDTPLYFSEGEYKKDISVPTVIYVDSTYTQIIPYLDDKQTYYFAKSPEEAKAFGLENFWYVSYVNGKSDYSELYYCKDSN